MSSFNSPSSSPSSVLDANTTMQPPSNLDSATLKLLKGAVRRPTLLCCVLRERSFLAYGDYEGALNSYNCWLEVEPESSMAHSNKSAAHMALKQWEGTYLSARKAQELDPSNFKAAYRRGVALMRMRCDAGAVSILETQVSNQWPELKEATLLAEQANGVFKPEMLYSGDPKYIIADYVGPVGLFQNAKTGRGLCVTRDVQPGELLFIENPVALCQRKASV